MNMEWIIMYLKIGEHAPNVWVSITQLAEYRNANPKVMGSNPAEVTIFCSV